MSYQDTYDSLCVLLEEYADADIETVATQIFSMFGLFSEDLLDALDPPTGLSTWLRQHGLSLMRTAEGKSPRVWAALEEEDDEPDNDPGEEESPSGPLPDHPLPQIGDHVEYRTAPKGPNNAAQIGAGLVSEVGDGFFWVHVRGSSTGDIYIVPDEGDFIRILS